MAQHVVGAEAAGDLAQRVVGQAQLFGRQFKLFVLQLVGGGTGVQGGTLQRVHVTGARRELAIAGLAGLRAGQRTQAMVQAVHADAVGGGHMEAVAIVRRHARQQIDLVVDPQHRGHAHEVFRNGRPARSGVARVDHRQRHVGALEFGEQLRRLVGSDPVEFEGELIAVTVSVGVATIEGEAIDVHTFIKRADGNLYRAKRSGRNCVVG